jgi:RNA recognition motif-containing protein
MDLVDDQVVLSATVVQNTSGIGSARDDRRSRSLGERILKKLYVGNLPFSATEVQVNELFSKHGTVHSVALINDRDTGRPRGFGFVEMDDGGAQAAIQGLNGHSMDNRELRVNEATDRPRGSGGGSRW